MTDSLILAVETSSRRGSVALGRGPTLLGEAPLQADRKHAAELFPSIQTLLSDAGATSGDVAVLAFSQGPGSFTGLRVAATLARIWQASRGARVVAVPSLEVIARNVLPLPEITGNIAVLLDARGQRVFAAEYRRTDSELEPVRPAQLCVAQEWLAEAGAREHRRRR